MIISIENLNKVYDQDIAMHTRRAVVFRDGQIISDKPVVGRITRKGGISA